MGRADGSTVNAIRPDHGLNFGSDYRASDTSRLWLSEQQWAHLVQRLHTDAETPQIRTVSPPTGERRHGRLTSRHLSCVVRLGEAVGGDQLGYGTFTVRVRDISSGGLGFLHDHPLAADTRCTLLLRSEGGTCSIETGRVAWCKRIPAPLRQAADSELHEIGLTFDRLITLEGLLR